MSPAAVEHAVKNAIRVGDDDQLQAQPREPFERGPHVGGNRLPEIVFRVIGTKLTNRRRGCISRRDPGGLQHHLHVHPRPLRVGGTAVPDTLVDLELHLWLGRRKRVW